MSPIARRISILAGARRPIYGRARSAHTATPPPGSGAPWAAPPRARARPRRLDSPATSPCPRPARERKGAGQQVIVSDRRVGADQVEPAVGELPLDDLEADLDLGQRVRHDLLVGLDPELREYVSLVADVVDHVRVIVTFHRADP